MPGIFLRTLPIVFLLHHLPVLAQNLCEDQAGESRRICRAVQVKAATAGVGIAKHASTLNLGGAQGAATSQERALSNAGVAGSQLAQECYAAADACQSACGETPETCEDIQKVAYMMAIEQGQNRASLAKTQATEEETTADIQMAKSPDSGTWAVVPILPGGKLGVGKLFEGSRDDAIKKINEMGGSRAPAVAMPIGGR